MLSESGWRAERSLPKSTSHRRAEPALTEGKMMTWSRLAAAAADGA